MDSVRDLDSFAQRAKKMGTGTVPSMRFQIRQDVLVVSVATHEPALGGQGAGLVVLGTRTFRLAGATEQVHGLDGTDAVYALDAVTERTARMISRHGLDFEFPPAEQIVSWKVMTPPRTRWELLAVVDDEELAMIAEAGIREVAEALPDNPGQAMINQVRDGVWGKLWGDPTVLEFPAGMAFASHGLGFLTKTGTTKLYRAGVWMRMSSRGGFVLSRIVGNTGGLTLRNASSPSSPSS